MVNKILFGDKGYTIDDFQRRTLKVCVSVFANARALFCLFLYVGVIVSVSVSVVCCEVCKCVCLCDQQDPHRGKGLHD